MIHLALKLIQDLLGDRLALFSESVFYFSLGALLFFSIGSPIVWWWRRWRDRRKEKAGIYEGRTMLKCSHCGALMLATSRADEICSVCNHPLKKSWWLRKRLRLHEIREKVKGPLRGIGFGLAIATVWFLVLKLHLYQQKPSELATILSSFGLIFLLATFYFLGNALSLTARSIGTRIWSFFAMLVAFSVSMNSLFLASEAIPRQKVEIAELNVQQERIVVTITGDEPHPFVLHGLDAEIEYTYIEWETLGYRKIHLKSLKGSEGQLYAVPLSFVERSMMTLLQDRVNTLGEKGIIVQTLGLKLKDSLRGDGRYRLLADESRLYIEQVREASR